MPWRHTVPGGGSATEAVTGGFQCRRTRCATEEAAWPKPDHDALPIRFRFAIEQVFSKLRTLPRDENARSTDQVERFIVKLPGQNRPVECTNDFQEPGYAATRYIMP
jgi:hypothetical protein